MSKFRRCGFCGVDLSTCFPDIDMKTGDYICEVCSKKQQQQKELEPKPTYDYLITFDMVDGHSYKTMTSNRPEAISEFMEKMVDKPYASILTGNDKLVRINLRNVTKINVSLKETEK